MANRSASLIQSLTLMVRQIQSRASEKFKAFYLKRVHETDLAPTKTFAYDFVFGGVSTSSNRRSTSKLKALVAKHILKNNPAVAMAAAEFIPTDSNGMDIILNMAEIEVRPPFSNFNQKILKKNLELNRCGSYDPASIRPYDIAGSGRLATSIINSIPEFIVLSRYVRYLKYLARKHHVPVTLRVAHTPNNSTVTDESISFKLWISVTLAAWIPATHEAVQRYDTVLQNGTQDDELFSKDNWWSSADLSHVGYENKYHISRFFVHLDKALKVVNTLTRKIEYGYHAYNFRTA